VKASDLDMILENLKTFYEKEFIDEELFVKVIYSINITPEEIKVIFF
jgi:hypothetical protein